MENRGWPNAAAMIEHPLRIRTAKNGFDALFHNSSRDHTLMLGAELAVRI